MNMDQLAAHEMNVFCRIVDGGSFAAAADDMGMTPSAVSKLVTRLEDRLGVRLLARTTRRLSLTAEGEIYLQSARAIVSAIEEAETELMASAAEPSGHLKINTGVVVGRHMLTPILPEFMARYPRVSVELNIADRQVDLIAEQVDIAIRTGRLTDSSLIARKLGDTTRAICASPAYLERHGPLEYPGELVKHNCMTVAGFSYLRRWPFLTPEGINMVEVSGHFDSDSPDVIVDMMLAGQGIGRLSRLIVADHIESGALVELFPDQHRKEPLPVHAIMPPGGNRALKVRAFLDFLFEHPDVKRHF
ncbi:LysR family transcriptional regulator [Rhizobium sp. L1K21]|uniref:LysR family transcriptional regulator n=1 Tax=Rhizobium sp. L1K21 TaxID=2954933 RepID=UPI0020938562|nr:LysR family transcriptional regulator [Rhizobium sp. L1K21]MCO6185013.1 LysR family transcriptional regulator [Rhizobium sp. L1K21]